jgi:hypothetical protein
MTDSIDPLQHRREVQAARCFDASGRLQRWPSKRADQLTVLWVLWSFLPAGTRFSEPEINSMLRDWHDYEDYALLRRELCDLDLVRRTPDGRIYRRVEHEMPPEAARLAQRFASPSA